jgi:ClpP class serine protease
MGASKIMMAPSSELGPIDPQIFMTNDGKARKVFSAHDLVSSYQELFDGAVLTTGNLEPYLLQLQKYDYRDIKTFKNYITLSGEIAVKALSTGMMKGQPEAKIKKNIDIFLDPQKGTFNHGRSINYKQAQKCGLIIEKMDVRSSLWQQIYELYARTDLFVHSGRAVKTIESREESFFAGGPNND